MTPLPGLVKEHIHLASVDSTNRYALETGRAGVLVTARAQTAGRGRKGRSWFSPAGKNIYMTLTLEGSDPRYAIVTGVAVRSALANMLGESAAVVIKWPNDLLIQGKKVCGILCEARHGITALGIGVNVNQGAWPDELAPIAIALAQAAGRSLRRDVVIRKILGQLEYWLEDYRGHGFEAVRRAFLAHGLDQQTLIRLEDGSRGVIVDLLPDGTLLIESAGERRSIVSGDIVLE